MTTIVAIVGRVSPRGRNPTYGICRGVAAVVMLCALLLSAGCERAMHNMYRQPKDKPYAESGLFPDGKASRPIVPGTLAYAEGPFASPSSGRAGRTAPALMPGPHGENPMPVTYQLLKRGQERFNIYCAPCHSRRGDGDGLVARRGFPHPPSYHIQRLREAPDAHFYDVITHGYGAMYPYADRVPPQDRWAIVAYIRALQFSQHAAIDDVPEGIRARMAGEGK